MHYFFSALLRDKFLEAQRPHGGSTPFPYSFPYPFNLYGNLSEKQLHAFMMTSGCEDWLSPDEQNQDQARLDAFLVELGARYFLSVSVNVLDKRGESLLGMALTLTEGNSRVIIYKLLEWGGSAVNLHTFAD